MRGMTAARQRILVVEDDEAIARMLEIELADAGYDVVCAGRGDEALAAIAHDRPDAVVLDLRLPDRDGLSVCRQARREGHTLPILMLTALDRLGDRVLGLDAGADDYLAKPFDLGELLARVKALIRRGKGAAHPTLNALGVTLNTLEQTVHRNGMLVDLSPTEYHILEYLLHHPRKVVSKQELLEHLYDYNWEHHSNVIEAHVSNLRKKLDAAVPDADPVIETLRGRGYRLSPETSS